MKSLTTDQHITQFSDEMNFNLLRQFSVRLIHAQEEERQRISQEMHDDLGNRIAILAMSTRQIIKRNSDNSSTMGRELNKLFYQIAELAIAVREISHGLHPVLLRHVGMRAALKSLKEQFESAQRIAVQLVVPESLPRLDEDVQLCMFRVTQESLQNVAKHSGADRVTVAVERERRQISLTISDNGHGFSPSGVVRKDGVGLLSMEARALSVKGRLELASAPGRGTEVRLSIPLQENT
jgi:signal transduction histidine kinase